MLIPYLAVAAGLVAHLVVPPALPQTAAVAELGPMELDDPALAKYKDQIEKDLANLE